MDGLDDFEMIAQRYTADDFDAAGLDSDFDDAEYDLREFNPATLH